MIVVGDVQGVGFRVNVRELANQYKLKGEVENLEDYSVRIICEGEKDNIERFIEDIRSMKRPISVQGIKVDYSESTNKYVRFTILRGDLETELYEGLSTGGMYCREILDKQDQMLDKQDQMLDKQDQMLDKQDQMLDKQDQMLDKQDQMLDKQDQTVKEIRNLSSNMHEMMNARFQRLEDEIIKIKARLGV